jgi:hypothetical protein
MYNLRAENFSGGSNRLPRDFLEKRNNSHFNVLFSPTRARRPAWPEFTGAMIA